jgi:hypothetical protein
MKIRHIRTVIAKELFICIRARNMLMLIQSRNTLTLIRLRNPLTLIRLRNQLTLKCLLQSFMHLDLHFICLRKLYVYRNGNKNNISYRSYLNRIHGQTSNYVIIRHSLLNRIKQLNFSARVYALYSEHADVRAQACHERACVHG